MINVLLFYIFYIPFLFIMYPFSGHSVYHSAAIFQRWCKDIGHHPRLILYSSHALPCSQLTLNITSPYTNNPTHSHFPCFPASKFCHLASIHTIILLRFAHHARLYTRDARQVSRVMGT